MTPNQYATEVMRIICDGTVRTGMWSERERDFILKSLADHHRTPHIAGLALIVDDLDRGGFCLTNDPDSLGRVRLADYRTSRIGQPERDDVAAVNAKLAAIPS